MARMPPEQERELIREFLSPNHAGDVPAEELDRHRLTYKGQDTEYRIIRSSSPGGLGYVASEWRSVPKT